MQSFVGMVQLTESKMQNEIPMWRRTTSSVSCKMFGRQVEEEKIMRILNGAAEECESNKSFFLLSIVGPGGIGKTALSQVVFDHRDIDHGRFDLKAWICVSNDFDNVRLSIEIMETAPDLVPKNLHRTLSWDVIEQHLMKTIKDRRFLLVFDDVWEESHCKWKNLCKSFFAAKEGSIIIVTTRNERVAKMMDADMTLNLDGLQQKDYCDLLEQSLLLSGKAEEKTVLQLKEIAKRFDCSPLAAESLQCALKLNREQISLENLLHKKIYELDPSVGDIASVLRLSYDELSEDLKQCFLACSLFPKYHCFSKAELLSIWMALGFSDPKGENQKMEDIAEEFLHKLLSRSFFVYSGKLRNEFQIHSTLHELAEFWSGGRYFRLENMICGTSAEIPAKAYHVYVTADNLATVFDTLSERRRLRSLVIGGTLSPHLPKSFFFDCLAKLLTKLKCLRLLILSEFHQSLFEPLSKLKHLRYLQFPCNEITHLHDSICKLYHLQCLILKISSKHLSLPKDMNKLLSLRYLKADLEFVSSISGIGTLTSLLELHFSVSRDPGFDIGQLRNINGLQRLCIKEVQNVDTKEKAEEAMLQSKSNLEVLKLHWASKERCNNIVEENVAMTTETAEILEALRPSCNLRELIIEGFKGFLSPSWLESNHLSQLSSIELSDCWCFGVLPPLGESRSLKVLRLRRIKGVEEVGTEFYGKADVIFPALVELVFDEMIEWTAWHEVNDDRKFFPCLQRLLIQNCGEFKGPIALQPILEKRKIKTFSAAVYLDKYNKYEKPCTPGLTLCIDDLHVLTSVIEEKHRASLLSLEIHGGNHLKSFEDLLFKFESLNSLKHLYFIDCYSLHSLPAELNKLTLLENFHLENCPELLEVPEMNLPTSLMKLHINQCNEKLKEHCCKIIATKLMSITIDGEELTKTTRLPTPLITTDSSKHNTSSRFPRSASFLQLAKRLASVFPN